MDERGKCMCVCVYAVAVCVQYFGVFCVRFAFTVRAWIESVCLLFSEETVADVLCFHDSDVTENAANQNHNIECNLNRRVASNRILLYFFFVFVLFAQHKRYFPYDCVLVVTYFVKFH